MKRSRRHLTFGLFIAILFLNNCNPSPPPPRWNQFHGDSANSGQTVTATVPALADNLFYGQIGQLDFTSLVHAPDGSFLYSKSGNAGGNLTGIFRMTTTNGAVVVGSNAALTSEQLSTPAVDDDGWVYATRLIKKGVNSELLMIPQGLQGGYKLPINGTALSPPKLLNVIGGTLIFVTYVGNGGSHLQIWNNLNPAETSIKQPKLLVDQFLCGGAEQGSYGFYVRGIDLPAPYPESPAVAVRLMENSRDRDLYDPEIYVVVASSRCAISFFRMKLAYNQTDTPTLTTVDTIDTRAWLSTPVISGPDGTVVINDSDKRTTAYDVRTAKEKWHYDHDSFVLSTPTLPPLNTQFVYIQSYGKIVKLDLKWGLDPNSFREHPTAGQSDASPAIGGQYIFVSTIAGLTTYDLDLKEKAFTPLSGGRSSPIINTENGQILVATTDGKIYVFKGP